MKVFTYSPDGSIGGLKILSYSYSRDASSLAGKWTLILDSGDLPFEVGDTVTLAGMAGGLVTSCARGDNGEWTVAGSDKGIFLQKTAPDMDDITEGGSLAVISALAGLCGLTVIGSGGLTGFNARSLISSNTCAEAVQELAQLSGKIAYIDNEGRLVLASPETAVPSFETVLSGGGESLDYDSYAPGPTVIPGSGAGNPTPEAPEGVKLSGRHNPSRDPVHRDVQRNGSPGRRRLLLRGRGLQTARDPETGVLQHRDGKHDQDP